MHSVNIVANVQTNVKLNNPLPPPKAIFLLSVHY